MACVRLADGHVWSELLERHGVSAVGREGERRLLVGVVGGHEDGVGLPSLEADLRADLAAVAALCVARDQLALLDVVRAVPVLAEDEQREEEVAAAAGLGRLGQRQEDDGRARLHQPERVLRVQLGLAIGKLLQPADVARGGRAGPPPGHAHLAPGRAGARRRQRLGRRRDRRARLGHRGARRGQLHHVVEHATNLRRKERSEKKKETRYEGQMSE